MFQSTTTTMGFDVVCSPFGVGAIDNLPSSALRGVLWTLLVCCESELIKLFPYTQRVWVDCHSLVQASAGSAFKNIFCIIRRLSSTVIAFNTAANHQGTLLLLFFSIIIINNPYFYLTFIFVIFHCQFEKQNINFFWYHCPS